MSAPPAPSTAAAVLSDLRAALLLTQPAASSSAHALGAASPGHARAALSRAVAGLRAAAAAAAAPGGERVAAVQADAARRREHVRAVGDVLKECRDCAQRADAFAPPWSVVMHRVKGAAEMAGAQAVEGTAEDASGRPEYAPPVPEGKPGPLLTVCGASFLVDFQFYGSDVCVYFKHLAGGGSEEVGDAEVDRDFVELVRGERFGELQRAFEVLMRQEELEKALQGGGGARFQLKDALRAFEEDVLAMQKAERGVVPGLTEDDYRDRGVGTVKQSAQGLRVAFADGWYATVGVEHASPPRLIASASCGPVTAVAGTSSAGGGAPDLPATFSFANAPSLSVGAQYVLTLSEPLIASASFAAELLRASNGDMSDAEAPPAADAQAGSAKAGGQHVGDSSDSVNHGGASGEKGGRPSMEALLSPGVLGSSTPDAVTSSHREMDLLSGGDEIITSAALPGDSFFKFSYNRNDCVPGVHIHRVPLSHPRDLPRVLRLLRQQIIFNALFSSCFSTSDAVTPGARAVIDQPIEVVTCDAPGFIHFGMFDAALDSVLGVGVTIAANGELSVKIRCGKGKNHACSPAKAAALFKAAAFNTPLALNAMRALGYQLSGFAAPTVPGLQAEGAVGNVKGPEDDSIMEDVIGLAEDAMAGVLS